MNATSPPVLLNLASRDGWTAAVQVDDSGGAVWQYTAVVSKRGAQCRLTRFAPPDQEGAALAALTVAADAWIADYSRRSHFGDKAYAEIS